jgi:hypothetical protein
MTGCARGLDGTSERTRTLCEYLLEPMLVVIGRPAAMTPRGMPMRKRAGTAA